MWRSVLCLFVAIWAIYIHLKARAKMVEVEHESNIYQTDQGTVLPLIDTFTK